MKTVSDQYPKIEKLQGKILFPHNIQEVTITDEDGSQRTVYEYDLLFVPDHGQLIDDYDRFKLSNYRDLRRVMYADWREQLDMLYHGTWEEHIMSVKNQFPKPEEGQIWTGEQESSVSTSQPKSSILSQLGSFLKKVVGS